MQDADGMMRMKGGVLMDRYMQQEVLVQEKDGVAVWFGNRPPHAVVCPVCWTHQRPDRESCYRCGARFVFDDTDDSATG